MAEEERLAKVQAVRKDAEERMAREKARAEEFDRIKQEAERKAKEERLWLVDVSTFEFEKDPYVVAKESVLGDSNIEVFSI